MNPDNTVRLNTGLLSSSDFSDVIVGDVLIIGLDVLVEVSLVGELVSPEVDDELLSSEGAT